ncbi:hypothetical protein ABKN59_011054 [Abortiporus biennis]
MEVIHVRSWKEYNRCLSGIPTETLTISSSASEQSHRVQSPSNFIIKCRTIYGVIARCLEDVMHGHHRRNQRWSRLRDRSDVTRQLLFKRTFYQLSTISFFFLLERREGKRYGRGVSSIVILAQYLFLNSLSIRSSGIHLRFPGIWRRFCLLTLYVYPSPSLWISIIVTWLILGLQWPF